MILVLALGFFLVSPAASAATQSELEREIEAVRRERETLVEEQAKLQKELEALGRESQTLGNAVKSLDTTRKKLIADINVTKSKITSANLNIRALERAMSEKEDEITGHKEAIALALRTIYAYDSRSFTLDLLSSGRISEVWRDRVALEATGAELREDIVDLKETKAALDREKEAKERAKEEQVSLQGQLSGQKRVVEENQNAKARLLAETKNKESEYQRFLEENLARQKQFEEDLFRLESELRIAIDPSLIPPARHSVLSWPLDSVFVTNPFGAVGGSNRRIYASGFHNGVDFRAAMGTPVRTMFAGVIEGAGNTDEQRGCYSYGRWVLIKHANGLSSIYAHLSASLIKVGQSVKAGEIIGYSGGQRGAYGSGYSFGPHLHVGLFASQGVRIQQFTTSTNCKQVYVPVADIKAYLDPLAYLPSL